MNTLPRDNLLDISTFLSRKSIINLSITCKQIYHALKDKLQKINDFCNHRAKCLVVPCDVFDLIYDSVVFDEENIDLCYLSYKFPRNIDAYKFNFNRINLNLNDILKTLYNYFDLNPGDIIYFTIFDIRKAIVLGDNYHHNTFLYGELYNPGNNINIHNTPPGIWKNFGIFANALRYQPEIKCWITY